MPTDSHNEQLSLASAKMFDRSLPLMSFACFGRVIGGDLASPGFLTGQSLRSCIAECRSPSKADEVTALPRTSESGQSAKWVDGVGHVRLGAKTGHRYDG